MKIILIRIAIALLTFTIGIALTSSYQFVSWYQGRMAKEAELRRELFIIRRAVDQYMYDKGGAPSSLKSLVVSGHLRKIPVDPITGKKDWRENILCINLCIGDCIESCSLTDVRSASTSVSLEGTPYNNW